VIQTFSGDTVARQDEDANFDGKIDRSFEGTKSVPVTDLKAPALPTRAALTFWSQR
jgi:hypothetical protein